MNDFLSDIPDDLVAVWTYTPEILSAIKEKSGKFGMLEVISQNWALVEKLSKLWVYVGSTNPVILLAGEIPDDIFFQRLQEHVSRFPKALQRYTKENGYHIRGWSPGDMKWLVDVMKTPTIQNGFVRDSIVQAIENVRQWAVEQTRYIAHYAIHEWVYWNSENIQIGVVPSFDVPIVTVTEDPNRSYRLFIDTIHDDGKRSNNRTIRRVEHTGILPVKKMKARIEVDPNDTSLMARLTRSLNKMDVSFWELEESKKKFDAIHSSPEWKDIAKIFALLKKESILDPNMTYQMELWWVEWPPSKFILFQVKEFAKKNPINTDKLIDERGLPQNFYTAGTARIITWMKEWEEISIPIVDGEFRWNIWEHTRIRENPLGFAARPVRNSDDLCAWDYHKDLKIFFHSDAHGWTLAHNSFRFAQSVVRKWGTIILSNQDNFTGQYSPKDIWLKVQSGVLKLIAQKKEERDILGDLAKLSKLKLPPLPWSKKSFPPKK